MGRSIAEALDEILRIIVLASSKISLVASKNPGFFVQSLQHLVPPDLLPEAIRVFVLSLTLSLAIYGIVGLSHIGLSRLTRGVATVFISYFHGQEALAERMHQNMRSRGLNVVRLPLLSSPHHDDLLDRIRLSITGADVVICVPGGTSSFVDHEVAMSFALKKPLFFILNRTSRSRLPNTAKLGYPVFDEDRRDEVSLSILARLCSYVAGDTRFTAILYAGIMQHLVMMSLFLMMCFAVCVIVLTAMHLESPLQVEPVDIRTHGDWLSYLQMDPLLVTTGCVATAALLLVHFAFFLRRRSVRTQICDVVSNSRFDPRFLPETIDHRLSREALLSVMLDEPSLAHHEVSAELGRDDIIVGKSWGKAIAWTIICTSVYLVVLTIMYADLERDCYDGSERQDAGKQLCPEVVYEGVDRLLPEEIDRLMDDLARTKDDGGTTVYAEMARVRAEMARVRAETERVRAEGVRHSKAIFAVVLGCLVWCFAMWILMIRREVIVAPDGVLDTTKNITNRMVCYNEIDRVYLEDVIQSVVIKKKNCEQWNIYMWLLRMSAEDLCAELKKRAGIV